jgi:hypothetical protein
MGLIMTSLGNLDAVYVPPIREGHVVIRIAEQRVPILGGDMRRQPRHRIERHREGAVIAAVFVSGNGSGRGVGRREIRHPVGVHVHLVHDRRALEFAQRRGQTLTRHRVDRRIDRSVRALGQPAGGGVVADGDPGSGRHDLGEGTLRSVVRLGADPFVAGEPAFEIPALDEVGGAGIGHERVG